MFKTIRDAFKVKEIRNGIIFTFCILIVVRLGSLIPTPGVNTAELSNFFANNLGEKTFFLNVLYYLYPLTVILTVYHVILKMYTIIWQNITKKFFKILFFYIFFLLIWYNTKNDFFWLFSHKSKQLE